MDCILHQADCIYHLTEADPFITLAPYAMLMATASMAAALMERPTQAAGDSAHSDAIDVEFTTVTEERKTR